MFSSFVNYFSGRASTDAKKCSPPRRRQLRIETLEDRRLLSVSTAEFAAIRSQYADLGLSENMNDYNIIEVTGSTTNNADIFAFTEAGIKGAITKAGQTTASDLIVVRTSTSQNTITLGGSELAININATQYGSVIIVSLREDDLTINASQKSRILNVAETSTVTLAGMTITGGSVSGRGGGIYNSGTLTMTNSTISKNSASSYGGGIYNCGDLTVTNSTITENSASSDYGGGIYNCDTLTITNSEISGNSATLGGGIHNNSSGTLLITNSTISRNSSNGSGGGVFSDNGTLTVTNSTISENLVIGLGGGIYIVDGTLTVTNSTITRNSGGIYNAKATVTLYNTIVAKNSLDDISGTLQGNNNLIGNGTGQTSLRNGINGNTVGTAAKPIDPRIAEPTQQADGSWIYGALLSDSPAINAGNNTYVQGDTDIVGDSRIQGGTVNIGAVEGIWEPRAGVIYYVTSLKDAIGVEGVLTFREAFEATNGNIAVGNAQAGSYSEKDIIVFAPDLTGTISLNGQEIEIIGSLEIVGSGVEFLVFDAKGESRVFKIGAEVDVVLSGMTITEGQVDYYGGGILNYGNLTVANCTVAGNSASCGGGILSLSGVLTVTNSTILGNSAQHGGGIYNQSSPLTVTNSTILGNSASSVGGGICNSSSNTLTVTNSMVSGNYSSIYGGGIYNSVSTVALYNTIVAKNSSDIHINTGTVQGYNNLIGNGTNQALRNGVNGNIVGINPRFTAIPDAINASNTGFNYNPTDWDLRLQSDSPAIDAGNNIYAVDPITGLPLLWDLNGNSRIFNGIVDIGAYEAAPTQRITAGTNVSTAGHGSTITLKVYHEILGCNPDYFAMGIGLVIYYDPEYVEYMSGNAYTDSAIGRISHDSVKHTITIGWNDTTLNWPGTADILELLSMNFIVKADAPLGEAVFRITANNQTLGFELITPDDIIVTLSPTSLDIDGNGKFDNADANLLLRYLYGYSGNDLTWMLVANNAERKTPEENAVYLEANPHLFDIDGDGKTDSADANLLLRYRFGYSGEGLTRILVANNATRKTADDIITYIESVLPASAASSLEIPMSAAPLPEQITEDTSSGYVSIMPLAISSGWGIITAPKIEEQEFKGGKHSGEFTFTLANKGDANTYIELNDYKTGDNLKYETTYLEIYGNGTLLYRDTGEGVKIFLNGLAAGTYTVKWQFDVVSWWFMDPLKCFIAINPPSTPVAPPTIGTQPVSTTYKQGETATAFSVEATSPGNAGTLSYQWQKSTNGSTWSNTGTNSATLAASYISTSTAGTTFYRCFVTNTANSKTNSSTSSTATITVIGTPVITKQPVGGAFREGEGIPALSVAATRPGNLGTLSYQWFMVGSSQVLSTAASYNPGSQVGTTNYYCVVTNSNGGKSISATSNAVPVTVFGAPNITAPPVSATYKKDETLVNLSVTAPLPANLGTPTYQWYKREFKGAETTAWTAVTGATSAILSATMMSKDAGVRTDYYCLITNTVDTKSINTLGGISTPTSTDLAKIQSGFATILVDETQRDHNTQTTAHDFGTIGTPELPMIGDADHPYYGISIAGTGKDDWYAFTFERNGDHTSQVIIKFNRTISNLNLNLYGPGGYIGSGTVASSGDKSVITFSFDGRPAGTYQIMIGNAGVTNTYQLTISPSGSPTSPTIEVEPISAIYKQGETATALLVGATNINGVASYRWESSPDGTDNWSIIHGANSADYTPPTDAIGTIYYRCVVINTLNGARKETPGESAGIVVFGAPVITTQPVPATYAQGETATAALSVAATRPDNLGTLSCQWQMSTDGGEIWSNMSGANSATLAASHIPTGIAGTTLYRCVVTNSLDGKSIPQNSASAMISVIGTPIIETHVNGQQEQQRVASKNSSAKEVKKEGESGKWTGQENQLVL